MSRCFRIGTRGSALALTQTRWVAARLAERHPGLRTEIEVLKTTGDQVQDAPLAQIGVTGLFTKELDRAMVEGRVDLAVHSLKDVPTALSEGILLAAVPVREDPRDVFIGKTSPCLAELPWGAEIGTGSLRRRAQLAALRPDLRAVDMRGNIDTRLRKLKESTTLDGIILAAAGVRRCGLAEAVTEFLALAHWLPAPGQGALAITTRTGDDESREMAGVLEDPETRVSVLAERALMARLESGCHVPLGAHARVEGGEVFLDAFVADPAGGLYVRRQGRGPVAEAERVGVELAVALLDEGGAEILRVLAKSGEGCGKD